MFNIKFTKWSAVYASIVFFFSLFYYSFWYLKPDSFIIHSDLNIHPFQEVNAFLWGQEGAGYTANNFKSLKELKKNYDGFYRELIKAQKSIDNIEQELNAIEAEENELSNVRNQEIDLNTEKYRKSALKELKQVEDALIAELNVLEAALPRKVISHTELELIKQHGDKKLELANHRVKIAHKEYLIASNILNNLAGFMSKDTSDRFMALHNARMKAYEKTANLRNKVGDFRSKAIDQIQPDLESIRKKLNLVDFVYFSVGISTTTTFGDIVANHRGVRALVSIQLILCVFILAGFVNSTVKSKS